MLIVTFHNDSTGDEIIGNYDWKVFMNKEVIAKGHLRNHNRLTGWCGLIKRFAKECDKKFSPKKRGK